MREILPTAIKRTFTDTKLARDERGLLGKQSSSIYDSSLLQSPPNFMGAVFVSQEDSVNGKEALITGVKMPQIGTQRISFLKSRRKEVAVNLLENDDCQAPMFSGFWNRAKKLSYRKAG